MACFKVFHSKLIIKEHHLDTFGHVNNAAYMEILEGARWDFLTEHDFGLNTIQALQCGPVVLEFTLKFKKELRLRQLVNIETKILSYDKKIGTMSQKIIDAESALCCEALLVFGFFDLKARKLILPTPQWLTAIGYQA